MLIETDAQAKIKPTKLDRTSDVDPHWSKADPDPQNLVNADPDSGQ